MNILYKLSRAIFFIIFLVAGITVMGQDYIIKGRVVDSTSHKNIGYASILNYSLRENTYSNSNGEFSLIARTGDTLVLYAVGYYYQKVIVDRSHLKTSFVALFEMKPQAYEITEVKIIGLGTYEDFKHQFMALQQTKTKTDQLAENLAIISSAVGKEAYDAAVAQGRIAPPSPGFKIYTPEEKERLVLKEILKEEKVNDQIYQKFNPLMVKNVTGLSNDDEIIKFMVFCDFTESYLLEVGEYDLMVQIARKYELFKKKKDAERSVEDPLNLIRESQNALV